MTHLAEFVLSRTITFEKALKEHLNAEGSGLGAMVTSVHKLLPRELKRKLQFLARERNKVTHDGIAIDTTTFSKVAEEARSLLNELLVKHKTTEKREKLLGWIAQCPVDLSDHTRQLVLTAVQQTSNHKSNGREDGQFFRPIMNPERNNHERRILS